MQYLQRVKERKKKLKSFSKVLTKLTKAPSVSFVSTTSKENRFFKPPSVSFVSTTSKENRFFQSSLIRWQKIKPDEFQHLWKRLLQGEPIYVYSEVLGEAVYWVRDTSTANFLAKQGIKEVCYTAPELRNLAGKPGKVLEDLHELKKRFSADIVKIEP